jgi:hypothetical protein
MPSIGETNGQITPSKKKILVLVEIISTHRGTIEAMNGTANGCPIRRETIREEVKISSIGRGVESPHTQRSLGKPVHTVQLLLADRMYKLRDVPQNIEFYGPPHPEDPQGE